MNVISRRTTLLVSAIAVVALAAFALLTWQPGTVLGQASSTGVQLKIISASIPADLKAEVTFSLMDGQGRPLGLADLDANALRFMIAAIAPDPDTGGTKVVNYVTTNRAGANYQFEGQTRTPTVASMTQAAVDSTGTFTDLGGGRFTYKFGTAAPADFNPGLTHALGGYATRNARAFVSNDAFYFVPAGGAVETMREVTTTQACNTCHDNLAAHGGTRRDTRICVLCHTAQTGDPETGNTVEFEVMIHKIHTGHLLPTVEAGTPYNIVGNSQRVFDFSGVRWPQDTRNCQTCHQGAQASNHKTQPSAEACGSCHDNVNFQTGAGHAAGPQSNSTCKSCHTADGPEFGLSVAGAHTIPEKSAQRRGVNFEFVSLTNTRPGQNPTVVYNMKDNAGTPLSPSEFASLAFTLAGPTTDYMTPAGTENAIPSSRQTGDGNWSYTFTARIPESASGTYAVAVGGYLAFDAKGPSGAVVASGVRDAVPNKIIYGAVTDPVPMPRKDIVATQNCNVCHETLALHGGARRETQFCVLCHNPASTDVGKRTTARGPQPAQGIAFGMLIHRIHTGEELEDNKPYIIYGGSPSSPGPLDMSEARYPTDRRNCTKCHLPGSNLINFMREGAQPVLATQSTVADRVPPIQAVCTACHDNQPAKAHAETQTFEGIETCAVCHNEGRDFAVGEAHRTR